MKKLSRLLIVLTLPILAQAQTKTLTPGHYDVLNVSGPYFKECGRQITDLGFNKQTGNHEYLVAPAADSKVLEDCDDVQLGTRVIECNQSSCWHSNEGGTETYEMRDSKTLFIRWPSLDIFSWTGLQPVKPKIFAYAGRNFSSYFVVGQPGGSIPTDIFNDDAKLEVYVGQLCSNLVSETVSGTLDACSKYYPINHCVQTQSKLTNKDGNPSPLFTRFSATEIQLTCEAHVTFEGH